MANFLHKGPCEACGSKDNRAFYDDGTSFCFSPGCPASYGASTGEPVEEYIRVPKVTRLEMSGQIEGIKDRSISKATCEKYGVTVAYGTDGQISHHWYPYYNTLTNEHTATKKRICGAKDFPWSGNRENIGLFGEQTCSGRGKYITITEGECDALAVAEMFDRKWDVVSLKNGAGNAKRDIQARLDFLEGYDHIVLCFDNDTAGQQAVDAVKDLFSPNKLKICTLPLKDAGEMLVQNRVRDFTKSWWDAKQYCPAGIVTISETWDAVLKYKHTPCIPYPWEGLNEFLLGQRSQEIVVWAADTGIGKSQAMREIQHHLINTTEDRVGSLMLEESVAKSALGWMSFHANRRLHRELASISEEEYKKYWEMASIGNRLILLDHQGWQNSMDTLKSRIRYMVRSMGCKWVVLDHLHIALSSISGATGDWSGIDELMTEFRSLVHELDICLHLVSHTSEGRNLRGSKGISKVADAVIYLERDKHNEDPILANTTTVVVDKNRFVGDTGIACYLYYDKETGRMVECAKPEPAANEEF